MALILLIDPAPEGDAAVLASALRVEGFEVVVVPSAAAARKVLVESTVALTIVDLMRTDGEKHGLELARELRSDYPFMRVLLTSAYHLSERQLERADCGVSGFIPKPYEVEEVVAFITAKVSGPPSSRRISWTATPEPGSRSGIKQVTAEEPKRTLTPAVDVDSSLHAARVRR